MKVAASPQIYNGRCPRFVREALSPVPSPQSLVTLINKNVRHLVGVFSWDRGIRNEK